MPGVDVMRTLWPIFFFWFAASGALAVDFEQISVFDPSV